MAVDWTRHRFSGGTLVLDVANTVVHRGDPARRFDRFADVAEIGRFAEAARRFRAEEFKAGEGWSAGGHAPAAVIAIREAADAVFRRGTRTARSTLLPPLLTACAAGLAEAPSGGRPTFTAALASSALALAFAPASGRVGICRNCDWLFLDRSRNGSRVWCDMAVCGNRSKARRHYSRSRGQGATSHG